MKAEHAAAATVDAPRSVHGAASRSLAPRRRSGAVKNAHVGPVTGLLAQMLLLAALAGTVGLSGPGWVVGVSCAVLANLALAHGLSRYGADQLGLANWVTLARATLAVGVAALVADSFSRPAPVAMLLSLAALALALDRIDGWIARRTRTTAALGAHFDAEVDAFLILILSVYVARWAGAWVLAIGAARYVFLAAGWTLPWMREQLPPRYWRKVVAATQGIALTIAAADVLPLALTQAVLVGALALLVESFGRDAWWLWSHRDATHGPVSAGADPDFTLGFPSIRPASGRRRQLPTGVVAVLTVLAVLIVWVALVAPDRPSGLTPTAFLRIPLEGLVLISVAVFLPANARRVLAGVLGLALGVVVILKILDIGFFMTFERPFDPIGDSSYAGIGIETLRAAMGRTEANLVVIGIVAGAAALLAFTVLAMLRLSAVTAGHRRFSLGAIAALGGVWVICWLLGAQLVSHSPIASTSAASLGAGEGRTVQADIRAAGFSARTAFVTSPTFGGVSWLAHSTLQSGVWADSGRRYNQLVSTDRFTLSQAFTRAGWRTIADSPADDRAWPQGSSFYHYDKVYDRRDVGYRGPTFTYAPMPDQYMFSALQRLELAKTHRRPLFAEVDTVSSHMPWNRIPQMIPWSEVGNGSIFNRIPIDKNLDGAFWITPSRVRAAYARSVEYSLNTLISFVQHYGNKNLVLAVVGDEQPLPNVSGQGASHDVPISLIAHDPAVLNRIGGWGWGKGLRPSPHAPVWPMSAFRDRFLTAFGSQPATR
ncbi:MAG: CDP-alcohol phosphatidyltransferase family protein [Actinobacteria bacterium]|nr:MAG: CDP-alcohol phosphatidyltransferase family protein [Actinomycetota bacterium]